MRLIIFTFLFLVIQPFSTFGQVKDTILRDKMVLKTSLKPMFGYFMSEYSEANLGLELMIKNKFSLDVDYGRFYTTSFNRGSTNAKGYSINLGVRKYIRNLGLYYSINWMYEDQNLSKNAVYSIGGAIYEKKTDFTINRSSLYATFGSYLYLKRLRFEYYLGYGVSHSDFSYLNINEGEIEQIYNNEVEEMLYYSGAKTYRFRIVIGFKLGFVMGRANPAPLGRKIK
jgi:hypothetical protein